MRGTGKRETYVGGQTHRPNADRVNVEKIDKLEEKLRNIIAKVDPSASKEKAKKSKGSANDRLEALNKLTNALESMTKEKDDQPTGKNSRWDMPETSTTKETNSIPLTEHTNPVTQKKTKPPNRQLDLSQLFAEEFTRFYMLKIPLQAKRKLNPYAIIEAIKSRTGNSPKQLSGFNSSSLTIEVRSKEQGNLLGSSYTIDSVNCDITPHPIFNHCRGIIYVEDVKIDDISEFKTYLQETTDNFKNITEAPFIKSKNPGTQVFIIEFHQDRLPHSIYIPGERRDTIVYKMRNKALQCNKCQQYGHPFKYCRQQSPTCRHCSETGHSAQECTSEVPHCVHCGEAHPAGDRDCEVHRRETQVADIQEQQKVTNRRARQIIENNNEFIEKIQRPFPTHFDCKMSEAGKRQFSPWLLEKCISDFLGSKPKSIRSKNQTTLTIEIHNEAQSKRIMYLKTLNKTSVEITVNESIQIRKGLIYIYSYDLNDFENYKTSMMNDIGVAGVEEATWIKPRSQFAKALLLSFRENMPNFISLPGEQAKTKVFPYQERPQICKKCQQFHHGEKYCNGPEICAKCSEIGHRANQCNTEVLKCPHCSESHAAGHKDCPELRFQQELVSVAAREGVSRRQAFIIISRNNPNYNMNFSKAARPSPPSANGNSNFNPPEPPKPSTSSSTLNVNRIDVVCQSPSGTFFKKTIDDPRRKRSP